MKLIIQIPCYNEEATLPVTIADLPSAIDGVDEIEILIIDDGSKDQTIETAKACGVHHIVKLRQNKGLAFGFMAGIDACLRLGADIIVNTDADNQYFGGDITKLVKPIIDGTADIVVGARATDEIEHFSPLKKRLQKAGSRVVRIVSGTDVKDAPSGFRAYSRDAALRLNVINKYTYTLETIIQAGFNRQAIQSVAIRTNAETRKSRLFKSIYSYIRKSGVTIIRAFAMYKPLMFFGSIGASLFGLGLILGVRFLIYFFMGSGSGHIQSLILSSLLMLLGFQTLVIALLSDIIAANRKILEDVQYRVKKLEYKNKE